MEITRLEWEQLIDKVDKLTLNPSERAKKIWILLQESLGDKIDNWDLMCFCSWYLSSMFPMLPELKQVATNLNIKIHQIHYQSDLWKDTNVIRKLDSDSKEGERISRNYSAE